MEFVLVRSFPMSWTRSNWALLVIVHTQVLQSISLQIYTFARVGIWFPRLGFAIGVRKESARQTSAGGTTTAVTTAVTTTFELVNIKSSKKQKWTKTNDRLLIIVLLSPGAILIARILRSYVSFFLPPRGTAAWQIFVIPLEIFKQTC